MNRRRQNAIITSFLALSLVACTGSPLSLQQRSEDPLSDGPLPAPKPTPISELEITSPQDEATEPPLQNLHWGMREHESPKDQQVQAVVGGVGAGGYKLFLQQGDSFYCRTPNAYTDEAPHGWSVNNRLPPHTTFHPTKLFSDGDWLFFVSDQNEQLFEGTERLYGAKEGQASWTVGRDAASGTEIVGVRAVASGPGFAFAATEKKLYRWSGSAWNEVPIQLGSSESYVSLSVDAENGNDLIVALRVSDPFLGPYKLVTLPSGTTSLQETQQNINMGNIDHPMQVYRSYYSPDANGLSQYNFLGFSTNRRVYYGIGRLDMLEGVPFNEAFAYLAKLMGRFYAFRGSEVYHLKDVDVTPDWEKIEPKKTDGSALVVSLSGANHVGTDGARLYAAAPEGLFQLPLHPDGTPMGAWSQEAVELNRAEVQRVALCGGQLYAKVASGTLRFNGSKWVPFQLPEVGGRPASLFSSIYGHVATVATDAGLDFYIFRDGAWRKVQQSLPTGFEPKANKLYFSQGRLFVAVQVPNGEAIYQRELDETKPWSQAAPDQGLSTVYPTYVSDGRNLFAININRVRFTSLAKQQWADYPSLLVQPDGTVGDLRNVTFAVPFGVYGYVFVWIYAGGEYRLCRATPKGWKALVNNRFGDATVDLLLSTDGTYLYATTTPPGGAGTRDIVRLPIKDGTAWEKLPATFPRTLKAKAPPFIDRASEQVFLPTSLGILKGH